MMTSMKTTTTMMTGSAARKSGGMTMTDDLVKRLRDFDPHLHEWEVVDEAADLIETLTVECNEARKEHEGWQSAAVKLTAKLESTLRDRKLILDERDRTFALMLARAEKAEAERDEAYARGYSDAETEISRSALGQRNDFLHSQYANAAARIKDLNELLDEAQTEWSNYSSAWMTAEGKLADAEDFIEHLLELLEEAASDLTAYVDAEYPPDTCAQYPDIANRRERDMELVRRIEAALTGKEPSHD
jgi:chromosome segregation ATPase